MTDKVSNIMARFNPGCKRPRCIQKRLNSSHCDLNKELKGEVCGSVEILFESFVLELSFILVMEGKIPSQPHNALQDCVILLERKQQHGPAVQEAGFHTGGYRLVCMHTLCWITN